MNLNDLLQAIGVAAVLILTIVWIIRRIRRKDNGCDCGCDGCPIKDKCSKQ